MLEKDSTLTYFVKESIMEKKGLQNRRQPRVERHLRLLPRKIPLRTGQQPGPNVIKLSTAVIY
jgi:hypothetical protein